MNECPLGSGALAGNPFGIDREALSDSLGFARPVQNSIDAVSDRDFVAELSFWAAMLQVAPVLAPTLARAPTIAPALTLP